ncbi:Xanthine dehydrogenase [Neofusicoccum parvum]|uniref:Xanthine dehydrogenase n=1 Tax=Neofusicoccum parvum TaxID=310453 RepID=A0ACB5SI48_9PEZI|nr:Xanthine dehydrogenase [Neofusicoccum parvum]
MAPGVVEPAVPTPSTSSLASATADYDDTLRFYLNGTRVVLDQADPEVTLLEYLRGVGLTGTKLGCAEGGCGACTVVVSQWNPTTNSIYHASVNACLAPLVSVDGKHVVTVEALGDPGRPHPVQERIAMLNGSQCGFCTPGIVMSLYALLRNNPEPTEHDVEEAFDGNLCRWFIEYQPDTELIFPPALRKHTFRPLAFGNKRKKWFRPTTLQQLLEIKSAYPSAKIIGGSTETQIEVKFKNMQYTASVFVGDIPELRQYSFNEDHLEIGGNVVLTDLENIAKEAMKHYGETRGQPFAAILKQLRYFAGRQIRNVGTPAGNLATASPISDLNPVFVATRTTLVAKSLNKTTEIPMAEFFKGYRVTALPPDAVIASLRIPVAKEKSEYMQAFKQAKRKDDDIAIVNAALRVSLSDAYTVDSIDLVYGGMAPTTVAAKKAIEFLEGKKWTDPQTLEGAFSALEEDFDLRFGVPGGMATYRKTLALSFFYKFYHEVLAKLEAEELEIDKQAIGEIEREISFGKKDHTVADNYEQKILGKERPHVAAMKQVTGQAQYTDDIPPQKNEVYGYMVLSTKAHAKLVSVDPSPALDLPGVIDWVDHTDLPNAKANWWGAPVCDEVFFAVDEVFTAGQPIGMILADSAKHAESAARAVKVEYEELPAIFTIEEAIEKESFFEHYRYIKKGDTEDAFKKCDHVFSGVARMGGQEHFYLETQACIVIPKLEDGEMEVWSSTQNPTETQSYVAQVTGVAANKIVAKVKRMGGGFGGKETRSVQLAGIVATAAKKCKRPRHPFLGRWKVGVNKDGKIQALDVDIFNNGGWSQDLSGAVVDRACSHADGTYLIPNVYVRGRVCKTNTVSNTAFRGFGGPQGMFIAESYMEEVADHLGMPVDQFRKINMYKAGDQTHFNQELKDYYVPLMYKQVEEESEYERRRKEADEFNKTHKWNKRGLSIIPTKFGISFTALFLNQAGALVHIYHDGSVLLAHGGTEMGQGLHTKMTMIAAEALGVPQDNVFISETATNTVANTSSTAASASSDLNGYAIWNACEQLNERLAPYREKLGPDATMKDLAHAAYFDRVNLSANGFYKTPDIGYTWGPNTGMMYFYFTQGVAAAEVEIDTLTGDWTCLRADIKMDVGRSINPAIDYGQIEGAFVQGQGLFTTEEMLWHRASGQIFTRGPGAYKIPGFRDIPQEFNVSLLKDVNWENLRTIQRSRGVGEPPLFMASGYSILL